MRIIKTVKQHRPYPKKPALSALFSKNGCCLSILILLFQFFPSFFFVQGGSLAWALRFPTPPQAIDDINEDTVFSPNRDGVQDTLLISFITDGDLGDFRIIIDTHGPSGVGPPDGQFRFDEDWVISGELGPGIDEEDLPRAIREAWDGNDFSRQQEDKNPRLLKDGQYRIQVEIDDAPNGEVNRTESGYLAVQLSAIIDNTAPELSSTISQLDLSPNGDNIIDEVQIDYRLSEDLEELELQFTNPSGRPAVSLTGLTEGDHSFKWGGTDGLRTILTDGVYTAQLHGSDKGGNVGTFGIDTIQIDTEPPTIVQLTPNRNSFQNTPIEQIEVIFDVDDGSLIDVESTFTELLLLDSNRAQIDGILRHDEDAGRITLTLDPPLDSSDENGVYTISISGADKAGNIVVDEVSFTFDNVAPMVTNIATDAGELTPDTSTTTKFTFLDVTLADNIDSRVNTASTIHLSGVEGAAVAGIQSQVGENGIRWTPGFPLATDGSYDGRYTITVQSRDRAGNEVEIQIPFIYDTQVPELVLTSESGVQLDTSPGAEAFLTSSLSVLTATFNDGEGGGIDFSKTSIAMFTFDQAGQMPIPVSMEGTLTSDEDNDTLEFRLNQPLERRDGSQDGPYRIQVRSTDKAGNTQTENFDIVYDTQVPTIVSTTPAENETVSSLSQVSILLADAESGIDFSITTVRLLRDGSEVRADDRHNGKDTVSLTLPEPLAIDGSGDGEYIIEITPVDRANNAGATVQRRFFVASRVPEIRLNTPTQTRINNLTTVDVQLFDYIGPGLDFSESKSMVTVSKNGAIVKAKPLTADEENARLVWTIDRPVSRDGSADGEYTVNVQYIDLIGEVFTEDFILNFDSQPPAITVDTRPQAANPLTADRIEVELEVIDDFAGVQGSGFDAAASTFQLFDANNAVIGGAQTDDGISIFVFRSEVLPEGGMYTLVVTLVDRAGNHSIPQWFIYDAEVPTIQAVSHIDPTTTVSNVSEFLTRVEATVSDIGTGIDFDRSLIQLLAAAGEVVPGTPYHDDEATIGWELITPLTREGNFDGLYSLRVNAIDKAGHVEEKTFALRYDTQAPTIHTALIARSDGAPIELFGSENPLITFPINQITVGFSDGEGSGMDILRTTISLIGPEGTPVGANQTDNGVDTVFLSFNSLRTDGSDDGLYRVQVTPTDLAGNTLTSPVEFQFFYGTRKPEVISTAPAEFASITQLTEVSATLQDHSGQGIDFDLTTILLKAPDQSSILGHQTVDEAQSSVTWELNQPLSRDGSVDGEYTIQLSLADKVGNSADVEHTFVYDTLIPTVVSVTTNTNPSTVLLTDEFAFIEQPFEGVSITLSDANGETTPVSGVDLVGTGVQLLGPGNMPLDITTRDDGVDTIIVSFAPLYQPGTYTVEITPRDMAGNVSSHAIAYEFSLDLRHATVSAVTIGGRMAPVEFVNRLDEIVATLEDVSGTGLNLTSDGSTITVTGPDGEIEGVQTSRGGNEIVWRPLQLATDGSADGIYAVTITPVNSGGRLGIPARYQFTLDTQDPEVASVTPIDLTQPVSHIGQQLIQVAAQVEDVGPADLEVDDQRLQLRDANGNLVPAVQTNDGTSQIFLTLSQPLATDGSDDGVYTVTLELMDKAGNLNSLSHQLIYDTLIPTIVSVTANTDPPTVLPSNGLAAIESSFDRLTIKLSDANGETTPVSGIDLVGTDVQLIGPENTSLGINTRDDGIDTIIVSFAPLYQPGTYTVEITPWDMAGNSSSHTIEYEFGLDLGPSTVSVVMIGSQMAPVEFVNRLDEIVATLEDVSGTGLNLTSDGSTITVTGPDGEVEGVQTSRGGNEIVWRPLQLATDGSADGIYTVTITPVNSGGRLGIPARYQFTLDTQEPEVTLVAPIDLTQPVSYIGRQLIQIAAQVEDVGPAGLEVEEQRLQLHDAGGNVVPAVQSDDRESQIFLTLSQPLTADGSDDGVYTVTLDLMDRAGNLNAISHQLVYDTQAPTLVSTNPTDGSLRSDDITLITARVNDVGGSGIDFAESMLTLLDSTDTPVSGVQSNDGNRRLTLQIGGLVADGNYTIRVEAIDRAGNGSSAPFETQFTYSSGMPVVVSTVPKTTPAEEAFTNEPLRQVSVELQSEGEGADRSTITLLAPDGSTVPGQQVRRGKLLIYRLLRELVTDGSDDGTYTIVVVPINSAGRRGEPDQFTFVYDTVAPEVIPTSIQLIVAEPGVNNSLVSVGALIADDEPSSGVDWDNLDLSWITLDDVRRNRKIDGTLATDEEQALLLNLIMPLASDGSQDGVYQLTIAPKDRAGNVSEAVRYPFFYDTRPPTIDTSSLFIDGQPLLTDSNDPYYPSATNKSGSIIIDAKFSDVNPDGSYGLGPDLVNSSISVSSPSGEVITGTTTQNGTDSIRFKSGPLNEQGHYQVTITSVGLDVANLGFQPTDSVTTQFLFETTKPIVELTDLVGETTFEDEPLPLQGTARDPSEDDIPASEVALVEVVGIGPDGLPIDPVAAKDDSEEEEDPWSRWSIDFLPSQSGEYNLDVRVTDRAGNAGIYDAVTVNFSVSLIFKGPTYVWPNPLSLSRRSNGDIAHFSFEVNVPGGEGARIVLSIYDFAGDLVYEQGYDDLGTGRSDNEVRWDLTNQSGIDVARGIYIFRLEAEDVVTSNRTNAVGKVVVVE
ncbi:hypothetical protein C6502_18790 [Candidatus Poribacteria bacterium]|nr:MAG: hypothetical protein C6502_18790 [Candidatus Poribacteria bacterium]